MAQHIGNPDWISAYLEWTEDEFGMSGQRFAVSAMEACDGWTGEAAAVYLEWIDEGAAAAQRAAAPVAVEPLREAILLMALRTESEFMHILRQALDDDAGMDWPGALESVEADVRALSGRIHELRAH